MIQSKNMSQLNWHTLSQIKINPNQSFIISWGTDGNNKIVCGRVHLRYYVAGIPTRYGVALKRWELSRLASFMIGHINGTDTKLQDQIDELTIDRTVCGDYLLSKRDRRISIKADDVNKILNLIPGLCFLLGFLRPDAFIDCQNPGKLLEDVFIWSRIIKEKDIDQTWDGEECFTTGKLNLDQIRILQKMDNLYDTFNTNIGAMLLPPVTCSKKQFNSRIMGQFIESISEPFKKDPEMIKSLALVLRGVSPAHTK